MRVAYLIDQLGSGGAQRQAVELGIYLRRQAGFQVQFVVYRDIDFWSGRLREHGIPCTVLEKPLRVDPRYPARLRAWLRRHEVDLLHAFLPWPSFWGFLAVRPMRGPERPVFVAAERSAVSALPPLERFLEGVVYRRSDAVTVNAGPAVEEVQRDLRVPAERIHYIPNGIDLAVWDEAARGDAPFDVGSGSFRLALVGGLRPEKNHEVVVDALARLGRERVRDWRVWFIGADSAGAAFAERVRRKVATSPVADVVRFAEPTPRIAAVVRRMDGVLLPSSFEGFPNVALEAMASRVPVVASRVGDVPNMIDDGEHGLLLDRVEPAALADALWKLFELGPEARARMGARARRRVEQRYAMPAIAERHRLLYTALSRRSAALPDALRSRTSA